MAKRGRPSKINKIAALGLRAAGFTSEEIAERINATPAAVKKFFSRLIQKNQLERKK